MKLSLTVFVLLIFSYSSKAESLVKILANPCSFTGETIVTSGVLAFPSPLIEPEKARLFLSELDFKYNNFEQSIIVPFSKELSSDRESYSLKYVHVEGVFDCSIVSHGVTGVGGFKKVIKLVRATPNPNYSD